MLGNLIGGFITILVGVNLVPSIADQVDLAQTWNSSAGTAGIAVGASNINGAASTILGLTTLFFCLGIMSAGIAVAAQGLRAAGLLGA